MMLGQMMAPGPMPGMSAQGPNPLMRQEIINKADAMSPMQFFAYQRVGQMPGHNTNILARLAQSKCCPGARAAGTREVTCANGQRYILENHEGGIRAVAVNNTRADCTTIYEGTWMEQHGVSGCGCGLGCSCGCGCLGESSGGGLTTTFLVVLGGLAFGVVWLLRAEGVEGERSK